MKKLLVSAALVLAAGIGIFAYANEWNRGVTDTDAFLREAVSLNLFEAQAGWATWSSQSVHPYIKGLAQQAIDAHEGMAAELIVILKSDKVDVPLVMTNDHLKKLQNLRWVDSINYVSVQKDVYEEAIDIFKDYAERGDNDALKAWSVKALPTLERINDITRKM